MDVGYDADKNQLVRHVTDVGNPNSQRWMWWGVTVSRRRKKSVQDQKKTHGIRVWYVYLHLVVFNGTVDFGECM